MSGLVTMTPSNIDHVGTSASINANGGVDFEGVTSLSLNGVFTGEFDNYCILIEERPDSACNSYFRLVDDNGPNQESVYTWQYLIASDNSTPAARNPGNRAGLNRPLPGVNGVTLHIYGPALPQQPTAWRSTAVNSEGSATLYDVAATHSKESAFDGFNYHINLGTMTGNLIVMGYAE